MKPHRAAEVLALGVLSVVTCAPLGIVAWVMGNRDLREMAAGTMDPSGKGLTAAGRLLGIIGTAILALILILGVFFGVFGAASLESPRLPWEPAR